MDENELTFYLNADLETRYQMHKAAYFEKYPNSNIEKFHRFEKTFLEKEIGIFKTQRFQQNGTKEIEIEIHLSQVEVLEYINSISSSKPPQQAEPEPNYFNNCFDNVLPSDVYKHFKAGLVDKGYFTEPELNKYLIVAFEIGTFPEVRFKLKNVRNKKNIEAVFYNYYRNVAGKIHGTQKNYAALLGEYFEGYKTTTVSSNFAKSTY